MAKLVVMPKLGLTMTEGEVSRWLKKEGEAVKEGEPLFEVETDKLTNTIEATATGLLLKILAQEGETLPCLAGVAVIGEAGEDISALVPGAQAAPAPEPAAAAPAPAAPAPKAPAGRVVASPAAKKLAASIAKNAPIAVRNCKKAINDGLQTDMDQALVIEEKLFGDCFETHDQKEGMAAFLEKRKVEAFLNK